MAFGGEAGKDGVRFALWAPTAKSVTLVVDGTDHEIAEAGEGFVRTSVEETGRSEPGTDLALLADGYASVTPIRAVGEDPGQVIDLARADA